LGSTAPSIRTTIQARGRIRLPDGTWAGISLPRADISLIANIQAGAILSFRGTAAPGQWLAASVAGCPNLAMTRIDRHTQPAPVVMAETC
jgi:hypothetical protein